VEPRYPQQPGAVGLSALHQALEFGPLPSLSIGGAATIR